MFSKCVSNIHESASLLLTDASSALLSLKRDLLCAVSSQAGVRSVLIGSVQWEVCLRTFFHYLLDLHLATGLQTQEVEFELGPFSKGHL